MDKMIPLRDIPGDSESLTTVLNDSIALTAEAAKRALVELRGDRDFTRRYFASDPQAVKEYARLTHLSTYGVEPEPVVKPAPMTADELDDFYQRKYDGPIPAGCLAAIEELRAKERLDRQATEHAQGFGRMLNGLLGE